MEIKNAVCYSFSLSGEDPMAHLRLIVPLRQSEINIINGIENNQIIIDRVLEGDFVIIQRSFPREFNTYKKIIEFAHKEGKPVVFDLDDLLFCLPENHPDRQSAAFGSSLLPMFQLLMEADLVSVSTPKLRDFVMNYNDNVAVLPNYFDDNLWQLKPPVLKTSEHETLTIGYMGGNSHKPDLEYITPVLLDLSKRYPKKIRFQFWGVQPPVEVASLTQVKWSPVTTYRYKDFAAFFQAQTADIFIAPLIENLFNRCKSPIKFFEYSALGAPGVFSRLETYTDVITHGHNGLLASSLDEWTNCLIQLIEDDELRFYLAKNAQETIKSNWLLSQNSFRWKETFQSAFDIISSKQNSHTVSIVESINFQLFETFDKKEAAVQTLTAQVAEKEQAVVALSTQVAEKEQAVQVLSAQVTEKEQSVQALSAQVTEKEQSVQALSAQVAEKESRIHSLDILVDSIYQSTSWKITRPVRGAKTLARKILKAARSIVWRIGAMIYHAIPISQEKKQQLKETSLRRFGFLSGLQPNQSVPPAAPPPNYDSQVETLSRLNPGAESVRTSSFPQIRVVDRKKISVIVTSYDHERYIKQCLDSILDQKGNFNLEIILGDDCSPDNTNEILRQYSETYPHTFKMMPKQDNMGVTKNLKRCLDACNGDFIAICEGDDYWTDEYKLQKQMEFLEEHKDYSMCFSSFMFFYEEENKFLPFSDQISLNKDVITTEDLIQINYIGNFSCCMYRTDVVRKLPKEIFDVFTVDWMFNMTCGEIGKIGFIKDCMSIYRKHSDGAWSGKSDAEQIQTALILTDIYDQLLDYKYHNLFLKHKAKLNRLASFQKDLLILDTIFPHPLSPFRYQEFISYLDYFPSSLVITTGEHFPALCERRSVGEVILEFEKEHPEYKERTIVTSHDIEPYNAKLAYVVFLYNMKVFLETLEKKRIPFIFTLYPGGGFKLNIPESDDALKKIFNSPQFRKVIVTQKITYDYLISKNLCNPDQIEFIFGVVTPLDIIKPYYGKKFFGFEKDTLDICFVSHKYMPKGIDKGYDVFIEVARKLTKIHHNIHYHVVGSFAETDFPINGVEGKITFYGLQKKEWFDSFYVDKDIILSPNVPFILMDGTFDGFPTASCTEAGLRNVAILCTDILQLNVKFIDGEDIIIIPHDSDRIVDMINQLYSNPEKLKKIAENGSARIRDVYSYANQIAPRIKILERGLEEKTGGSRNG
jgi:glycosyltransferase involved in cell wall biosynthesis